MVRPHRGPAAASTAAMPSHPRPQAAFLAVCDLAEFQPERNNSAVRAPIRVCLLRSILDTGAILGEGSQLEGLICKSYKFIHGACFSPKIKSRGP